MAPSAHSSSLLSSSSFSLAPRDIDPGPFHSDGLLALTIVAIVAVGLGIAFALGMRCCCCAKKTPRKNKKRCNDPERDMAMTMPPTTQPHWFGQERGEVSTPSTDSELPLKEPLGSPPPYSPQQPEPPAPTYGPSHRDSRSGSRGYQEMEARPAPLAKRHEVE